MSKVSRRKVLALGAAATGTALAGGFARRARAGSPIKLGVSLSLTGNFSDSAKYQQEGYLLWSENVNAAGGIAGRLVELTIYDDESKPDTGRVLAERLIDRDNVLAILGPYSSPITDAMATAMERAQVPMIGTIASDSSIWDRRKLQWSFQAFPSSTYDHEEFFKIVHAKAPDVKKISVIYVEAPFSISAKDHAVELGKSMGIDVDVYGYNPNGGQDFRSIIERIVASGSQVVSLGSYYQPGIVLTRQMIERGLNPIAYQFIESSDGVTKDALGANANGIFGRSAWEPAIDTPESKAFVATYQKKFNRVPSYHSATAYAAGQLMADAIAAKGDDRTGIRDFLAQASVNTVMGKYKANEKGQQVGYRYVEVQWQGGVSKIVSSASPDAVVWPKPKWQ